MTHESSYFCVLVMGCENHENLDRAKISRYMMYLGMATTQLSCIGAGLGTMTHESHCHFSETFLIGHSVYQIMLNLTKKFALWSESLLGIIHSSSPNSILDMYANTYQPPLGRCSSPSPTRLLSTGAEYND